MFCPNCGKDCKDAKFCPECGEKLQRATKNVAVWQPGMPCPNCGSTSLNGNCCDACGAQLVVAAASDECPETDSYEIPYGLYRDPTWTGVNLGKNFLAIESKPLFKKKEVFEVPYEKLLEVKYERDSRGLLGYIHFCWDDNGTVMRAKITFSIGERYFTPEEYFHLFAVIKYLAPESTSFTLDIPENSREDIDFNDYFRRFAPYRGRAISALCKEYALKREAAAAMIRTEFEIRQMKLYADEPALAVRDLNRVRTEFQRLVKIRKEERLRRAIYRAQYR